MTVERLTAMSPKRELDLFGRNTTEGLRRPQVKQKGEDDQCPVQVSHVQRSLCLAMFLAMMSAMLWSVYRQSAALPTADHPADFTSPPTWQRLLLSDRPVAVSPLFTFWVSRAASILPCMVTHCVISMVTRHLGDNTWRHAVTTWDLASLWWLLGTHCSLYLLSHFAIMYLCMRWCSRAAHIWVVHLALLGVHHVLLRSYWSGRLTGEVGLVWIMTPLSLQRLLSFSLDYRGGDRSLYDMVHYWCYLPLSFAGPYVTPQQFTTRHTAPPVPLRTTAHRCLRLAFWTAFIYVFLQMVYVPVLPSLALRQQIPDHLYLGGLVVATLALHKALWWWMFHWGTYIAQQDGVAAPECRNCLLITLDTVRMWREIDPGLYAFELRYIYLALGGGKRRTWAVFVVHLYTGLWHGATTDDILFVIYLFILHMFTLVVHHSAPRQWLRTAFEAINLMFIYDAILVYFYGSPMAVYYLKMFIIRGNTRAWCGTFLYFWLIAVLFGSYAQHTSKCKENRESLQKGKRS